MVFKAITANADLNNAADQYGVFDDTILVLGGVILNVHTWEGNDTVYTTRSTTGQFFVNLGQGDDRYIGGAAVDVVQDGSGNDVIDLGAGRDQVDAGTGNDVYIGGAGSDLLRFNYANMDGNGVNTTSFAAVTFDLAKTTAQNVGVFGFDTATGFEGIVGGGGKDRLFGTAGVNVIDGAAGADFLDGRAGNDKMAGGSGADTVIGGAGADSLSFDDFAAGARDIAKYLAISESGVTAATMDGIDGFDRGGLAGDDKIDLSAIDANTAVAGNQAFIYRGSQGFTTGVAGEVRLVVTGTDTFVHVDINGNAASEMIIKVMGVTGLTSADFIL